MYPIQFFTAGIPVAESGGARDAGRRL